MESHSEEKDGCNFDGDKNAKLWVELVNGFLQGIVDRIGFREIDEICMYVN